jgi:hypothetical protein
VAIGVGCLEFSREQDLDSFCASELGLLDFDRRYYTFGQIISAEKSILTFSTYLVAAIIYRYATGGIGDRFCVIEFADRSAYLGRIRVGRAIASAGSDVFADVSTWRGVFGEGTIRRKYQEGE